MMTDVNKLIRTELCWSVNAVCWFIGRVKGRMVRILLWNNASMHWSRSMKKQTHCCIFMVRSSMTCRHRSETSPCLWSEFDATLAAWSTLFAQAHSSMHRKCCIQVCCLKTSFNRLLSLMYHFTADLSKASPCWMTLHNTFETGYCSLVIAGIKTIVVFCSCQFILSSCYNFVLTSSFRGSAYTKLPNRLCFLVLQRGPQIWDIYSCPITRINTSWSLLWHGDWWYFPFL